MENLRTPRARKKKKAIDELRDVILQKELTVTGIFKTGHYLHNSNFFSCPVTSAKSYTV